MKTRRPILVIIEKLTGMKPALRIFTLQEAPVTQDQLIWYTNYLRYHKTWEKAY